MPKVEAAKATKRASRNTLRGARRTGHGSNRADGLRGLLQGVGKLIALIPWQRCLLHLSIFCFWLLVLTAFIFGARWVDHPITRIEVVGKVENIDHEAIRAELADVLQHSFFTLDLIGIRQRLEARPWVKKARVEREWPSLLRVSLEEESVAALWNQQGFINPEGKIVIPGQLPEMAGLPVFYGSADQAEKLLATYQKWQPLLASAALEIESLRLQPRGAWQIGFTGGWTLKLGKADIEERLQRFITLYDKRLYQDAENILAIDARYTQGVSVAWRIHPEMALVPKQI